MRDHQRSEEQRDARRQGQDPVKRDDGDHRERPCAGVEEPEADEDLDDQGADAQHHRDLLAHTAGRQQGQAPVGGVCGQIDGAPVDPLGGVDDLRERRERVDRRELKHQQSGRPLGLSPDLALVISQLIVGYKPQYAPVNQCDCAIGSGHGRVEAEQQAEAEEDGDVGKAGGLSGREAQAGEEQDRDEAIHSLCWWRRCGERSEPKGGFPQDLSGVKLFEMCDSGHEIQERPGRERQAVGHGTCDRLPVHRPGLEAIQPTHGKTG